MILLSYVIERLLLRLVLLPGSVPKAKDISGQKEEVGRA